MPSNQFENLPMETSSEPVQAWKIVRLRQRPNGTLMLSGVHLQTMHPIEGEAICLTNDSWPSGSGQAIVDYCNEEGDVSPGVIASLLQRAPHTAPDPTCRCGFYAWKDPKLMVDYAVSGFPDLVPIRVELWGRVLQFERGYRAQFQRVLGIYLPPACSRCRTVEDVSPQLFKGITGYGFLHMLCADCTWLLRDKLCDGLGPLHYESTWKLADIASQLHCEVSLMENTHVNMRRMLCVASRNLHRV